ncbi:MAG TPA: MarR family transcriptional regulator [Balneolaceae bacterium]|nr:MarR family transcriptional regulator [Balneolaceae bacterium]|tara:strand:- start:34824 stop:35270 length:447 start_codon:yes stop_codon:yes gene_type:complete
MPTHYKGTQREVDTLNAFIKLMRASNSISNRLSRKMSEENITESQFGILEALYHLGCQNQRELGAKILKSGGNITMVIDNLIKRGYVERKQNPEDRRAVIISLTKEGEKFIEKYFPVHLNNIVHEFSALTSEELETLAALCKKVGKAE